MTITRQSVPAKMPALRFCIAAAFVVAIVSNGRTRRCRLTTRAWVRRSVLFGFCPAGEEPPSRQPVKIRLIIAHTRARGAGGARRIPCRILFPRAISDKIYAFPLGENGNTSELSVTRQTDVVVLPRTGIPSLARARAFLIPPLGFAHSLIQPICPTFCDLLLLSNPSHSQPSLTRVVSGFISETDCNEN